MFLKPNNIVLIIICAFALNHVAALPNPLPGPQTPTPCPTCGGLLAQLEATCCRDAGCNGYLHCNPTCKCVDGHLVGACNCHYSVVTFLATGTILATNRSPARKCCMICMKFFLSIRSTLCAPFYQISKAEVEISSQERVNTSSKCRIVPNQVYDLRIAEAGDGLRSKFLAGTEVLFRAFDSDQNASNKTRFAATSSNLFVKMGEKRDGIVTFPTLTRLITV